MDSFEIVLLIGLIYTVLASLAAYLIAYNEYAHHFAVRREAMKHAFEVALVAFLFFAVVTVALGLLLSESL